MLERIKGIPSAVRRGLVKLRGNRRLLEKVGFYAALTLLLAILGAASYGYRARRREAAFTPSQPPRAALAVSTPRPTAAPTPRPPRWQYPLDGEIVGAYSPEAPVWSQTLSQWQTHPGLDISGSPGEAVCACADGTVTDAWQDRLWGNVIVVDHGDGYESTYAGLNTLELVSVGDAVAAGQVISAVGNSAICEGELPWHLHFELKRDGEAADLTALVEEQTQGQGAEELYESGRRD